MTRTQSMEEARQQFMDTGYLLKEYLVKNKDLKAMELYADFLEGALNFIDIALTLPSQDHGTY